MKLSITAYETYFRVYVDDVLTTAATIDFGGMGDKYDVEAEAQQVIFVLSETGAIKMHEVDDARQQITAILEELNGNVRPALFNVAPANAQAHKELYERLQQIRDRQVSDDMLMLEAADIITDAQAPLLDIIFQLEQEFKAYRVG